MNMEGQRFTPVEVGSEHDATRREANRKRVDFNKYFREQFKANSRDIEVDGLGRSIKIVDVQPKSPTSAVTKIVVPGWTESVHILKPLIRAWVKEGEHVLSYTPGKLINPKREDYPQVIWDAIDKLNEVHLGNEKGRAALASLENHAYFPIHVQRALELLTVINTTDKKVKLHAHSQGLPIAIIASLLEPEKIHSILGDSGAGTIGEDKFSKMAGRFAIHLTGSTVRAFKGPNDAYRTVRGGLGAVTYGARNRTKALREAGVIASTDIFPALEYLDNAFNVKSALIVPNKDRLFPQNRIKTVNNEHRKETGYSAILHEVKGGHNEIYVRADKQVKLTSSIWR